MATCSNSTSWCGDAGEEVFRFFPAFPGHEEMIMPQPRDDVRADRGCGKAARQFGGKSDGLQAGMHAEADPRAFAGRIGEDDRQPFVLSNQCKCVWRRRRVDRRCKRVAVLVKYRVQRFEQLLKIAFAAAQ